MSLSDEERTHVYNAVNKIERLTAYSEDFEEIEKATDTILSTCGVPDRVAEDRTTPMEEVTGR